MSHRKHVMLSLVLVVVSGLLYGCGESTTNPIVNTSNEAPIVAPTDVIAMVTADGVHLSWHAVTQPNLRGYNVYRLDRDAISIRRLNSTDVTRNNYTDRSAEWRTEYEYRVTAISTRGTESAYSVVEISTEPSSGPKDPNRDEL